MAGKLSLVFALSWAFTQARHVAIPLTRHDGQDNTKVNHARHLSQLEEAGDSTAPTIVPETYALQTFWYASFDVGDAKNICLEVDTSSPWVVTSPHVYKPSSQAVKLHHSGKDTYNGTQPDACGTLSIDFDLYEDTVSVGNLVSSKQHVADTHHHKTTKPGEVDRLPKPVDGILGLSGGRSSLGGLNDTGNIGGLPFFTSLCNESRVDDCRFGIAYGTSGMGQQILGGVDDSLYGGQLSTAALYQNAEWIIKGNVTVKGSTFSTNQTIFIDTGTANIQGPIDQVRHIFDQFGYQTITRKEPECGGGNVIFGYYPCNSPPEIGFTVGNQAFNIEPAASALENNGNNNCTSTLVGVDYALGGGVFWLVGQAWMEGKYLDFDLTVQQFRAALLKDPMGAAL